MSYSAVKQRITSGLQQKYTGKLKDFSVSNVEADVTQILVSMVRNKEIVNFERVKATIVNSHVMISCGVFIDCGKFIINMKVDL